MTFEAAYQYLLDLPRFSERGKAAYKPGLQRITELMTALEMPMPAFPMVHVAGTNGKGSTASMLAAVATAAGRKTGLHTSPHLRRVTERMRVDGQPAPERWLAQTVTQWHPVFKTLSPSFFEVTVALSLLYFAEQQVDLAIIEVGLGGRLDATNIIHPALSLITMIGHDHADILGHTLPEIAREKAGIIKPGVPVLTNTTQPEVQAVLRTVATGQQAAYHQVQDEVVIHHQAPTAEGMRVDVTTPTRTYTDLAINLPGNHQAWNAMLALRAAEMLLPTVTHDVQPVYTGMAQIRTLAGLRGRLERVGSAPAIFVDVAHNPDGMAAALRYIAKEKRKTPGRLFVLFGLMKEKDAVAMAALLTGIRVFLVDMGTSRAIPPSALTLICQNQGVQVEGTGDLDKGIAWFRTLAQPEDLLLVIGSHQLIAAWFEANDPV